MPFWISLHLFLYHFCPAVLLRFACNISTNYVVVFTQCRKQISFSPSATVSTPNSHHCHFGNIWYMSSVEFWEKKIIFQSATNAAYKKLKTAKPTLLISLGFSSKALISIFTELNIKRRFL